MSLNITASVKIRTELWIDTCKKCMTRQETEQVRQLREKIDNDMKLAALRVLRKFKDVEVKFL